MKEKYKFVVILETLDKESGGKGSWQKTIIASSETDAVTVAMNWFFKENKNKMAKLFEIQLYKGQGVIEIKQ